MTDVKGRLLRIVLDGETLHRLSALQEADLAQAVNDLQGDNEFIPSAQPGLQSLLHLSIQEGRLVFDIRDLEDQPVKVEILDHGPL